MGRNSVVTDEDKAKSMEDWGKIKTEILKLKCNQYGIVSTGKKIDIQRRLYEYFHVDDNDEVEVQNNPVISTQGDNINNDILSELHLLRNEINLIKVKQNSMIHNSSITSHRVNTVTACVTNPVPGDPVFAEQYVNMANVCLQSPRNTARPEPVHGFQLPEFMETTGNAFDSSQNVNQYVNPFIPLPTKINILKKMEKNGIC